jgi:hypothetical protein
MTFLCTKAYQYMSIQYKILDGVYCIDVCVYYIVLIPDKASNNLCTFSQMIRNGYNIG